MKREFSAGGIVIKDGKVLLIKNAALRDPKKAYWGFPKGHIHEGEKSEAAAVREVKEETGLDVEIVKKLGDSHYIFTNKQSLPFSGEKGKAGEKVFKLVIFYLLKYVSGELKAQELEVLEVGWYEPQKALELLSFKKDREFLEQAMNYEPTNQ